MGKALEKCEAPCPQGKGKRKGLGTCYMAAYTSRLMTSSIVQSRKRLLIGMS